jgi:hypothetical protein
MGEGKQPKRPHASSKPSGLNGQEPELAARLVALESRVAEIERRLYPEPKVEPPRPRGRKKPRCPGCHLEVSSIARGRCPWCGFLFAAVAPKNRRRGS